MKETRLVNQQTAGVSRRALLKTASAAAVAMTLVPSAKATTPTTPVYYGTGGASVGQTDLNEKTIFPLLAAWLLITTGGPPADSLNEEVIACVANVNALTAKDITGAYKANPSSFDDVRSAFVALANKYALAHSPYSGGQCPDNVNTITPIVTLFGTPTTDNCKVKGVVKKK